MNDAQKFTDEISKKLKDEIKTEVNAEIKANNPNPYAHNRTLTPTLNKSLREFAEKNLNPRFSMKLATFSFTKDPRKNSPK